jgi:rod shape-determining protein MreC
MAGYDPPPFFKQGPAPLALLTFYVALSLALLILDAKFRTLEFVRQAVSVVTHPIQVIAQLPVQGVAGVAGFFEDQGRLQKDNERLGREQLANSTRLLRLDQLEAENLQLRRLLGVRDRQGADALAARVLYSARDPFTRRVVVDLGLQHGVAAGQPVIDEQGIVGQVTRVFPLVSEVTLSTDKDHSVPVQIVRNGLRSVSFGLGNGQMELRYMPANADVQVGDVVVTSGLDGIYHAGFPVARVDKIERDTTYSFARILCSPIAGVENHQVVLLLKPKAAEPARPAEVEASFSGGETPARTSKPGRRAKRANP